VVLFENEFGRPVELCNTVPVFLKKAYGSLLLEFADV